MSAFVNSGRFAGAGNAGTPGVLRTMFITTPTGSNTTWGVPSDWNNSCNCIHTIGGGGGGATAATGNRWGTGGAGGGWSGKYNLTLTPSATIDVRVGVAGAVDGNGGDTWFNGTTLAGSSCGAKGGTAGGNTAGSHGVGGALASGIGDVKRSGGDGGEGNPSSFLHGGGGGGGAAGPGRGPSGGGQGGLGGSNINTSTAVNPGAGGGAGAGKGNVAANTGGNAGSGSTPNGGAGGVGFKGTGAGAGGVVGLKVGGAATALSGSGGGGAYDNSDATVTEDGGAGATSDLWTQSSDSANAGPGGGGGGAGGSFSAGNTSTATGGNAGNYGAGGGGGGIKGVANTGQPGGTGSQGLIVVQYIPSPPATDYANARGTGSRSINLISTTTNLGTSASDLGAGIVPTEAQMAVLTDGVTTGSYGFGREWGNANGSLDKWIMWNFLEGWPVVIDAIKLYNNVATNFGSWTIEGSQDASSWTTLKSSFTLQTANGASEFTFTNTTAYQYYRLHTTNITNGGGGSGIWEEFEFKIQNLK